MSEMAAGQKKNWPVTRLCGGQGIETCFLLAGFGDCCQQSLTCSGDGEVGYSDAVTVTANVECLFRSGIRQP